MATAAIYKILKKGYYIHGHKKTVSGFRIASEPFIHIPENFTSIDVIADAIKSSLTTKNNEIVPDPKNWGEFNKNFLQKIGLKSLKELYKSTTKYILINKEEVHLIFTPTKHAEKPDEGFLHKKKDECIVVLNTVSNQEIVKALEVAFSNCE